MIHADGDAYVFDLYINWQDGDWVDDKSHGFGRYYHSNGIVYVG